MVKIEEGKYYRTKNGLTVLIAKKNEMGIFCGDLQDGRSLGYGDYGEFLGDEGAHPGVDIISEWQDAQPTQGPIREVRRREVVPGVYGRVKISEDGKMIGLTSCGFDHYTTITPGELREAAHLFVQLAEVLEDGADV